MNFNNIKISKKLPFLIVCLAILSAVVTGVITVQMAKTSLHHATEEKLIALEASRSATLEGYLKSIEEDLSSLASNGHVKEALYDFIDGWNALKIQGNPKNILQDLYIERNPNPTGSKEELDYALDGSLYSAAHREHHKWFRHFLRQKDYYDIFLFAPNGDLVYTVFKELDYATNLNTGEWKDTDLGNAFRAARDNPKENYQAFFDFRPYAPSNNVPASFISQPILDANERLAGVLVFQMPISRINAIMNIHKGLGETGETYLVGADHLMRSDSRFSDESTILKKKIMTDNVDKAIAGEIGADVIKKEDGKLVLSAYGPAEFQGVKWAVMAEIDEAEVMKPIYTMMFYAALAVLVAVILTHYRWV